MIYEHNKARSVVRESLEKSRDFSHGFFMTLS
jgi:hypothetical protein